MSHWVFAVDQSATLHLLIYFPLLSCLFHFRTCYSLWFFFCFNRLLLLFWLPLSLCIPRVKTAQPSRTNAKYGFLYVDSKCTPNNYIGHFVEFSFLLILLHLIFTLFYVNRCKYQILINTLFHYVSITFRVLMVEGVHLVKLWVICNIWCVEGEDFYSYYNNNGIFHILGSCWKGWCRWSSRGARHWRPKSEFLFSTLASSKVKILNCFILCPIGFFAGSPVSFYNANVFVMKKMDCRKKCLFAIYS